ncbi:hypothetical protein [Bacillus halotolerans]
MKKWIYAFLVLVIAVTGGLSVHAKAPSNETKKHLNISRMNN